MTTTVNGDRLLSPPAGGDRVLAAVRLQLLAWPSSIALGWAILAISFTVNLVLWSSMGDGELGEAWTGGLLSIYILVFSAYITSMNQIFPLAVGFGLTRRAFYLAMATMATVQAVSYGVILELLGLIEVSTDGWGSDMAFFRPGPVADMGPATRIAGYAMPFLVVAHIGICLGVIHRRWGSNGIYALVAGVAAVVGAVIVSLTLGGWWGSLGRWLGDQSAPQLAVLWPLPLLAVLILAGRLGIRRAVP
jgi:hypothetical protein